MPLALLMTGILAHFCMESVKAYAQAPIYYDYPSMPANPQPLRLKQLPKWISLDGELRGRMEAQTSLDLRPSNDRLYVDTRVRGGITLHPTSFITGYMQFQDAHALGLPLPQVAANQRDAFDLFQGYLDIHRGKVHVITGRQRLEYGSQRVVGSRDWSNISRSFDGFKVHWGDKNWIDGFASSVVTQKPTSLDTHGAGLNFYGAVGTVTTWIPRTEIQPFVYVRRQPHVMSQQSTPGAELETTFGASADGDLPGGIHYDALVGIQRGVYSTSSIHSGACFVKTMYQTRRIPWRPRFGGEYNYATGNSQRNPHRVSTYDQLYPNTHNIVGLVDLLGFENISGSRIDVDLMPVRNLTLLFQTEFLHVASIHDNVYSNGGVVLIKAPPAGFVASDLGRGFDASGNYLFRKYIDIQFGVGHFFPGGVMTKNGEGSPLTLGYLQLTHTFSANGRQR